MIRTLALLAKGGRATQRGMFPDLAEYSRGLPMVTASPCAAGCDSCMQVCPTDAIRIIAIRPGESTAAVNRGLCVACGACVHECASGTIVADRRTAVAVTRRSDLVVTAPAQETAGQAAFGFPATPSTGEIAAGKSNDSAKQRRPSPFRRSLHVREVSTGDNASDLEVAAAENPIFDAARFGIQTVASPRFADALAVTGPVARAMREPLQRCHAAMAEPRLVVAIGAAAISGGLYRGGYAGAEGVDSVLPVDVYVPGNPPHPWSILHGLLLAMGHPAAMGDNL